MKDGELRGFVLEKFYDLRNQQPGMVNVLSLPEITSLDPNTNRLFTICKQLSEHGLIDWKPLLSLTSVDGVGKITARGVDVVEGTAPAPSTVILHDHSISVNHSSNVQIGDSNTISVGLQPGELTKLVTELTKHLDELGLDARQKQRAEGQIAVLNAELAVEPDPTIVKQAGSSLLNITEGAIGSLLASGVEPVVWQWIHQMLGKLAST